MKQRLSRIVLVVAATLLAARASRPQESQASPSPQASPAAEAPTATADTPTFPAQVELVTVDVVVTDKKGSPITDLKQEDFVLNEDGAPQAIASFEAIQVPPAASPTTPAKPKVSSNTTPEARTGRSFVIVFDDVHLAPFQAIRAKAAVTAFLTEGVREGDRVTLIATGGGAWWTTRMEAGRDELIALLKRLDGRLIPDTSPERITDYEAMRIHVYRDPVVVERVSRRFQTFGVSPLGPEGSRGMSDEDPQVFGRASDVYFQAMTRMRVTLEVLERALASLAPNKGRKTLVLVSQGFIYDPNLDEFKRTVEASRRSNVACYFLDTRGLEGMSPMFGVQFGPAPDVRDIGPAMFESLEAAEGAESIAADSGGFSVKNTNDLNAGIKRIANESRSYYLIGYHPKNTARDGKFRKIQVKVARKGVQVRSRKGYYAPLEGKSALTAKKPPVGDPAFQAALDSPYEVEEVPLRMTAYVFDETLLGKATVAVAADVDVSNFAYAEKEGRFTDTLEFLLVVAHRETGEYFRYDQKVEMKLLPETRDRIGKSWFPIVRDFELASGGYQAKIVVRDKLGNRIGTVVHEFEVPALGELRVSSPVISDTLQQLPEGASDTRPRPQLLARRDFEPGATVYCSFEVYGAAKDQATGMPKVSAGWQILSSDGATVASAPPSVINPTSLGRLSRLVGTRLEGYAAGDYKLVMSLKDEISGKTLELQEPFSVVTTRAAGGQ
jgi:VWFA-related protein